MDSETKNIILDQQFNFVTPPKYSKWKCELFGSGQFGIAFYPLEGQEPNWFWRTMQFLFFGNRWTKEK